MEIVRSWPMDEGQTKVRGHQPQAAAAASGHQCPGAMHSNFVLSSFSCCSEYGRQEIYSVLRDYSFATFLPLPDTMDHNAIIAAVVASLVAAGAGLRRLCLRLLRVPRMLLTNLKRD